MQIKLTKKEIHYIYLKMLKLMHRSISEDYFTPVHASLIMDGLAKFLEISKEENEFLLMLYMEMKEKGITEMLGNKEENISNILTTLDILS